LLGYRERSVGLLVLLVVPIVSSIAFFLIADIDSPRGGVIRVVPHNLIAVSQLMNARQSASPYGRCTIDRADSVALNTNAGVAFRRTCKTSAHVASASCHNRTQCRSNLALIRFRRRAGNKAPEPDNQLSRTVPVPGGLPRYVR